MNERQLEIFSRQILLREVGGRGQKKLLVRGVSVAGLGPRFDVVRAALAAGGSPVAEHAPDLVLREHGALAQGDEARAALVVVGPTFVAYRTADGCGACFGTALAAPDAPEPLPAPDAVGSLAALIAQRILLDLAPERVGRVDFFDGWPSARPRDVGGGVCPHAS
jgi:hypothetical protein